MQGEGAELEKPQGITLDEEKRIPALKDLRASINTRTKVVPR